MQLVVIPWVLRLRSG